jgi:proteasome lid subunit RPN8/RPN11
MVFSLPTLLRAALGRPPKLVCSPRIWNQGVEELKRRAAGRRESGAFLLGNANRRTRRIQHFLYYDDVDPNCFANGIVEFDGSKFGLVWAKCRALKMSVVADVHVHPGHYSQSRTDRQNPMIAELGHFALIVPDYAACNHLPGEVGVYEYLGARQWRDHSAHGARTLYIGWWPQ